MIFLKYNIKIHIKVKKTENNLIVLKISLHYEIIYIIERI